MRETPAQKKRKGFQFSFVDGLDHYAIQPGRHSLQFLKRSIKDPDCP